MRTGLKELASQGRRFGHRRLRLLSARQEGRINRKKLYWLYREERWPQTGTRHPGADGDRAGPNLRWSLDFVMDTLVSGRRLHVRLSSGA